MKVQTPNGSGARVLREAAMQPRPRLLERVGELATATAPVVQLLPQVHLQRNDSLPRSAEVTQMREAAHAEGFREGLASAVESDRRAGYDAGFDQGLEQGRAAAESAVEQRLALIALDSATRAEHITALLAAFESQLGERLQTRMRESEDDMVALSHAAICRILGQQTVPGATTRAAVSEAIAQWLDLHGGRDGAWVIQVHPRDLERLQSDASLDGMMRSQVSRNITWQADPLLTMGGCIISSERGRLDARLDTQMAALAEVLCEGAASELARTDAT